MCHDPKQRRLPPNKPVSRNTVFASRNKCLFRGRINPLFCKLNYSKYEEGKYTKMPLIVAGKYSEYQAIYDYSIIALSKLSHILRFALLHVTSPRVNAGEDCCAQNYFVQKPVFPEYFTFLVWPQMRKVVRQPGVWTGKGSKDNINSRKSKVGVSHGTYGMFSTGVTLQRQRGHSQQDQSHF